MIAPAETAPDLIPFLIWATVAFFCGVALFVTAARLLRAAVSHQTLAWTAIVALPLLIVGLGAFVFACQAGAYAAWSNVAPAYLPPGQAYHPTGLWTQEQADLDACQALGWTTVVLTALLVSLGEWLLSKSLARRALRQAERPASAASPAEHPAREQFLQRALLPLAIGKPQPERQEWQAAEQNNDSASFQVFSTPLSAPAWPDDE